MRLVLDYTLDNSKKYLDYYHRFTRLLFETERSEFVEEQGKSKGYDNKTQSLVSATRATLDKIYYTKEKNLVINCISCF